VLLKLLLKINQTSTHSENERLIENGPYLKRGGGGCCAKEGVEALPTTAPGKKMVPTTAAVIDITTTAAQVTAVTCGRATHASTATAKPRSVSPYLSHVVWSEEG
jgi:hypothetical protein